MYYENEVKILKYIMNKDNDIHIVRNQVKFSTVFSANYFLKSLWKFLDSFFKKYLKFNFTECVTSITTDPLPSGIVCHIPSTCTTIQCCVDATTPLGRSFTTVLDLDPCTHQLTLGIENFEHKVSLLDFKFGMHI